MKKAKDKHSVVANSLVTARASEDGFIEIAGSSVMVRVKPGTLLGILVDQEDQNIYKSHVIAVNSMGKVPIITIGDKVYEN